MNSIFIWGTPDWFREEERINLMDQILKTLEPTFGPIVVFFPPEGMKLGLGKKMVVYISGSDLPREDELRQMLASMVGNIIDRALSPDHIKCVILDEPPVGKGHWSRS